MCVCMSVCEIETEKERDTHTHLCNVSRYAESKENMAYGLSPPRPV